MFGMSLARRSSARCRNSYQFRTGVWLTEWMSHAMLRSKTLRASTDREEKLVYEPIVSNWGGIISYGGRKRNKIHRLITGFSSWNSFRTWSRFMTRNEIRGNQLQANSDSIKGSELRDLVWSSLGHMSRPDLSEYVCVCVCFIADENSCVLVKLDLYASKWDCF